MTGKLFATLVILFMLLASGCYLFDGDVRRGLYWLLAAALNAVVTY